MSLIWWLVVPGALIGCIHAIHVYRVVADAPGSALPISARGLYYAVWTVALWAAFGSYVIAIWLLGCLLQTASRLLAR